MFRVFPLFFDHHLFEMLFAGSLIILSLTLSAVCTRPTCHQQKAEVITSCVAPKTVALTFVCAAFYVLKNALNCGKM